MQVASARAIDFLGLRNAAFGLSGALLGVGLLGVLLLGLRSSIDFAGGTLLEVHFDPPVSVAQVREQLARVPVGGRTMNLASSEIKQFGSPNDILIRVAGDPSGSDIGESILAVVRAGFRASVHEEDFIRRHEKVGPKIGSELTGATVRAVLVSLGLILLYMAWRFHRVLYGFAAVVALFHDVLITLGLLSLLRVEISLVVVAGILTLIGYSLNDTIVVFDRIRENLRVRRRQEFVAVLNTSINETLSRTLITSLTTLMAVLILLVFGGGVNRDFAITLLVGIVVGTYSSIFVATPVMYLGHLRDVRREASVQAQAAVR